MDRVMPMGVKKRYNFKIGYQFKYLYISNHSGHQWGRGATGFSGYKCSYPLIIHAWILLLASQLPGLLSRFAGPVLPHVVL